MSKVQRFEDLKVWQASREFCKTIHAFTSTAARDYRLVSQIKASSGSVMDNMAEGYERDGNKEFIQFLAISKGSCGECRSQLYRALDCGYISQSEFDKAHESVVEISRMLNGLMAYLKESGMKGKKFK
jgi:four helix bundle protein